MSDIADVTPRILSRMPLPHPGQQTDKNARGRVLVLAGREVPGAALLAGEGALRAGAGKLQIGAAADLVIPLGVAFPEARVVAVGPDLRECLQKGDAVIVGPGWIEDAAAAAAARSAMEAAEDAAFVIDAAAMTGLGDQAQLVRRLDGRAVLTPHAGEMASLLARPKEDIEADPVSAAREAASRFGAVVTLKGATTFIAAPDGRVWRHDRGVPGLATSGSGDVLAGVIGGLLARGADPQTAAVWGVHLHAAAGRMLARSVGELGFLARELPARIPGLLGRPSAG